MVRIEDEWKRTKRGGVFDLRIPFAAFEDGALSEFEEGLAGKRRARCPWHSHFHGPISQTVSPPPAI